ncbi:archaellin/type IV pilin N-terminal domain-containing protein [Caldisphaera sp.]|uniref:archaellin/type IV pilin N-terminal domain-containing protein n=1 Tax=Caldisphaera sp. TaxID=2060322 RepID=UPI0025B93B5F|nr:archaellin/type IV pilin N-terminal domain-containing protein [Caldisphaera sp.]
MKYTIKGLSMRKNNKAISDIVAVVMLILIAIAAAVLIYLWLSGLVGSVHSSNPALTERISINAVVINFSSSTWYVTAYVLNSGSSPVTINALYVLNASNGATLFGGSTLYSSVNGGTQTSSISIPANTVEPVVYRASSSQVPSAGTPIIVEVTTTNGVQATYQLTWP